MGMHPHQTKDYVDCCPSMYQSFSLVSIGPLNEVPVVKTVRVQSG